ncbi:NDR1/HIN1-like protein 10 [Cardamine amara subsp. amara]|uniref:NDR1/HIN1-like protein 10 n=1 Tax=Cardamine amara subsp. amara TaxID=228776 RepID=A0ABD1ALZ2_CARAN
MPSPPEEETQPKPESGPGSSSGSGSDQTSERDTNQPPPPPPPQSQPPPLQQPQAYPPVMGFPGYHQQAPYPSYPNAPYNHQQYAYAQAPPASYYGSPYPPQQNPVYQRPASSGFFRGIFTGLIVLVVLLCISTTITWLILRPQIPDFSLTNFSVSNFNLTEPVLSAQWMANLTIENPNTKLKGYFDRIQGLVYHENAIAEDEFLAMSFFPPVFVETKKSVVIGETLTAGRKEQPQVPSWVGEEMKKEKETGTVTFNLRMAVWVTFKTDGWSARERGLKVFCGKLKVGFEGSSVNGAVLLPKPLPCLVYV